MNPRRPVPTLFWAKSLWRSWWVCTALVVLQKRAVKLFWSSSVPLGLTLCIAPGTPPKLGTREGCSWERCLWITPCRWGVLWPWNNLMGRVLVQAVLWAAVPVSLLSKFLLSAPQVRAVWLWGWGWSAWFCLGVLGWDFCMPRPGSRNDALVLELVCSHPNADLELLHTTFGLNFVTSQHFSSLVCSLWLVGEDGTWLLVVASASSPHSVGMGASPLVCFWGNCGTPAPQALSC